MTVSNIEQFNRIASGLNCTRNSFSNIFLQAQGDTYSERRMSIDSLGTFTDDQSYFLLGIIYAHENGFYDHLRDMIIEEGFASEELLISFALGDAPNPYLQAIVDANNNFNQPGFDVRGNLDAMKWTGKVLIDGNAKGSGILIGADLFLTSWHVLKTLFINVGSVFSPKNNEGSRINVLFDDFNKPSYDRRFVARKNAVHVNAVEENWCVVFSTCHEDEFVSSPPKSEDLQMHWDYVIIRLAEPEGQKRRWAKLDSKAVPPRVNQDAIIYQYPQGTYLVSNRARVTSPEDNFKSVIPQHRFLHLVNTSQGSSGAPCFDRSYTLFGIHQGIWNDGINRGVPVMRIVEDIKSKINDLPPPDSSKLIIRDLGAKGLNQPVFGTASFQKLIWRSIAGDQLKIIEITGTEGSGKTYLLEILNAMLSEGGNLKLTLEAKNISKMDVMTLAVHLCASAKAEIPDFVNQETFGSTQNAWITSELVPKTLGAIEVIRNGRMVWLMLKNLNVNSLDGEGISEFLIEIYQKMLDLNWIRVVLDGMEGDLPYAVEMISEKHRPESLSETDFVAYYESFFSELGIEPDDVFLPHISSESYEKYLEKLTSQPKNAKRYAHGEVSQTCKKIIARAKK